MTTTNRKRFKGQSESAKHSAPLRGALAQSPKELRVKLGLTQGGFWAPVGVSQSGGSRYETGRKLPASISTLLHLVHIEGIDLSALKGQHALVGRYLSEQDPETYARILKAAQAASER
jgi:DNA-binding transcriptional regulator YiaG